MIFLKDHNETWYEELYRTVNLSQVANHQKEKEQKFKAIFENDIRDVYNQFYLRGNIVWGPTSGVKKVSTL